MLPELFLERIHAQLGEEYDAFLQSLQRPRAVALRFNPLKGDIPALPFVTAPVPWEPMGYYYDPEARPGLHVYHEAGVYYLQEASAMSPVALLDPQPGEIICDLCAAPGGKSTQIAGRLLGQGMLVCNEINPKRAKILSRNMERLGIAGAVVTNETPAALSRRFEGFFDRVLVDAPCSGEGMFRKEEAAVTDWSPEAVQMCARRQGEILDCAAGMVRPGGRLVYSTCTFAPQEDEEAVQAFLERHPDFVPERVEAPWFVESGPAMYRMWPHKLLGEGHFAAVLRRMGALCQRAGHPSAGRPGGVLRGNPLVGSRPDAGFKAAEGAPSRTGAGNGKKGPVRACPRTGPVAAGMRGPGILPPGRRGGPCLPPWRRAPLRQERLVPGKSRPLFPGLGQGRRDAAEKSLPKRFT